MFTVRSLLELKLVYIIVFISLSFWAIFAYYTMNELISHQDIYAKIINISGKQRMLSQKTTLMAKRSFETKDKKLINHTIELLDLMKSDHDFLISNLTSENIRNIYFAKKFNLDKNVKEYFKLSDNFLKNMNKTNLKKMEEFSFNLLPKLNHAVYEFEKESNQKTIELKNREFFILLGTLLTLILEAIIIVIPSIRYNEKKEKELKTLNEELQNRVKIKLNKIKEKEKIINEQAKMIALREVLNNIAHQWRQPLSVITTSASGLKLQKEYEQLTDENFNQSLDLIMKNGEYLSKTLNKFRDFFEEENEKTIFKLENIYKKAIETLKQKIEKNDITIVPDIEDITYSNNENKLLTIIMHIFSNSLDELENKAFKKYIFINIFKKQKELIIEVIDNAGGIEKEIIDKIYQPYFTTKHESLGKGMNLYIVKESVEKILQGKIYSKNISYDFNNEKQKGLKTIIKLPIK